MRQLIGFSLPLEQQRVPTRSIMPCGGTSLTKPNMATDIKSAVQRFSAPDDNSVLKKFYDEEGIETPDLLKLNTIERLHLLAEMRETLTDRMKHADDAVARHEAAEAARAAEKAAAENVPNPSPKTTEDVKDGK